MNVYMDKLPNHIVTPEEAETRLFAKVQEFEWEDTIASFSWEQIEGGLTEEFKPIVRERFKQIHFPLRFTEYEFYGDESSEDEKGEGENRIWPPEAETPEDENGETT